MFEQVFENMRAATESSIKLQQELLNRWVGVWSGVPAVPGDAAEKFQQAQKKWLQFSTDLVKRQRETLEAQFRAGLKNIEEAFQLAQTEDAEELRAKTIEFWQKSIDCMRQAYEAQMRDFQAAAAKWTELILKGGTARKESGKVPASV